MVEHGVKYPVLFGQFGSAQLAVSPPGFWWKINPVLAKPRALSTPYSTAFTSCPGPSFSSSSPPLFLPLIRTNRSHALSLWIIPLNCLLISFNASLQAPSVITVFQGRRGDVWWWVVTCCFCSSWLVYLVRPVPTVCRLKMSVMLMKCLGVSCWSQVQSHHHCALLDFIKVHHSLVYVILTVTLLTNI